MTSPKSPAPPKLAPRVAVLVFGLRDAYHEAREAHARYVDALTKYGERRAEAFMAPRTAAVTKINAMQAALKAELLKDAP